MAKVIKQRKPRFRFMAMSKLIGIIAFGFVSIITIYAMHEIHVTGNHEAMSQLIISAYGFASIYAGFYLTMAKVEHVEEEKTKREKELKALKTSGLSTPEEIEIKKQEINDLLNKANELLSEVPHTL